jgi:hypothetical protein
MVGGDGWVLSEWQWTIGGDPVRSILQSIVEAADIDSKLDVLTRGLSEAALEWLMVVLGGALQARAPSAEPWNRAFTPRLKIPSTTFLALSARAVVRGMSFQVLLRKGSSGRGVGEVCNGPPPRGVRVRADAHHRDSKTALRR